MGYVPPPAPPRYPGESEESHRRRLMQYRDHLQLVLDRQGGELSLYAVVGFVCFAVLVIGWAFTP
jgi:hypothetical protein